MQVLRKVKKDASMRDIPVVIVSCLSAGNHDKLPAEGAEEYLKKEQDHPRPQA